MYTGYVTRLHNVRKHPNADALQIGECFGNPVIVSMSYVNEQLGVYFPVDGQLSEAYCKTNDLVRRVDENGNKAGGYLEPDKRNIKALRLRGERSDGLFMPLESLEQFCGIDQLKEGDAISVLNGTEICCKYIPRTNHRAYRGGSGKIRKTKVNFAPTFKEHIDTEQLAYNLNAFKTGDVVELTLKMHGTSGRTGYLPLIKRRKPTLIEKILRRPGKEYTEYGYVTGTRRVVLDEKHDGGFYSDNGFRRAMAAKFEGKLHKGETVYYEIVGFVNENTPIMATVQNSKISDKNFTKQYGKETVFSYGCDPSGDWEETSAPADVLVVKPGFEGAADVWPPKCDVYVYRMTMTNEDGDEVEYSPDQVRERCEKMNVKTVPVFERFIIPARNVTYMGGGFVETEDVDPGQYVLQKVEQYYDGPDPIGKTHIREGVVARIVNRPRISVYKHKNFSFKVLEGIAKDVAVAPDMEEAQELNDVAQD